MVLPVLKLGSLLVRTASKPIASRLQTAASYHPQFRGVIIQLAQGYHRITTVMQRHVVGLPYASAILPLNEERAVEAAASLLGELFVFSVAGLAIIYEVQRNARSETKKEELRKKELEGIKQKNENLLAEVNVLRQKLEKVELLTRKQGMYRVWSWKAYERDFK